MQQPTTVPYNSRDGRAGEVLVNSTLSDAGWKVHRPTFEADGFDRDRRSSPWSGHRWFAYDLIRWFKPKNVVELGSHYGCSFFSFCQAVRDEGLSTRLIAVDTWRGDDHAGHYADDVHDLFRSNLQHFAGLDIEVKRMTFDEALDEQPRGSVDLLHIDGFHTYEALQHDLTTWLPTLSDDAVVLLHDIDPGSGYGSADFWREVAARYEHVQFHHNFGLGVVPIGSRAAQALLHSDFGLMMPLYELEAKRDLAEMQIEDLTAMLSERAALIRSQDDLIADRDAAIAAQGRLIDERVESAAAQARYIDDQAALILSQDGLIADRDEAIAAQARYIDEQAALIRSQDRLVGERDALLRTQAAELTELKVAHGSSH